jgi:hypothetical protein
VLPPADHDDAGEEKIDQNDFIDGPELCIRGLHELRPALRAGDFEEVAAAAELPAAARDSERCPAETANI